MLQLIYSTWVTYLQVLESAGLLSEFSYQLAFANFDCDK